MQRSGAVEPVAPVHVEAAPQQHIEAVEMAGLGRQVQERAVPGAARDGDFSRMLGEQVVEIFGAPLDGGGNDLAVKTERIDMRLEGAPAGKAVVACDLTLGLVEFCRRIACAARSAAAWRPSSAIQCRDEAEAPWSWDTFFLMPGVRVLGQKEDVGHVKLGGGLNPSRGPLVGCSTAAMLATGAGSR